MQSVNVSPAVWTIVRLVGAPWALCFASSASAVASIQIPSNPQSRAECDQLDRQISQIAGQQHEVGNQYYEQRVQNDRQMVQACSGGNNYDRCTAPYRERARALYPQISHHYAEASRIRSEGHTHVMACYAKAKVVEERLAQQRHQEQERQRQAQENQRIAQDNQRRQLAAQEAQQAAYQRDMERMQREREREQARQPRVIAQTAPESAYMVRNNEPRFVQTPQMQAQQQAAQLQAAQLAQQQQAEAQRQAVVSSLKGLGEALSRAGRNAEASGATAQARTAAGLAELNVPVNAMRGGSPVGGAIAGSSLAATGAKQAEALTQFDQVARQMEQAGTDLRRPSAPVAVAMPPARPSAFRMPEIALQASPEPPSLAPSLAPALAPAATPSALTMPVSSAVPSPPAAAPGVTAPSLFHSPQMTQVRDANPAVPTAWPALPSGASAPASAPAATPAGDVQPSPREACGNRSLLELHACMAEQCRQAQHVAHAQCEPFKTP